MQLDSDVAPPPQWHGDVPSGATRLTGSTGDTAIGVVVITVEGRAARIHQVWVQPESRGLGHGRELLATLRPWLRSRGVRSAGLLVPVDDPAALALVAGLRELSAYMVKPIALAPPDLPSGFGYRPMTQAEYVPWRDQAVREYAVSIRPRMGGDADAALLRSTESFMQLLPDGLDTAATSIVVLTQHDVRVGYLWLAHHRDGETYGYDLEIEPDRRGEGLGRAGVAVGERLAAQAGDARLGLNVFGDNVVARGLYVSWGFRASAIDYDVLSDP